MKEWFYIFFYLKKIIAPQITFYRDGKINLKKNEKKRNNDTTRLEEKFTN